MEKFLKKCLDKFDVMYDYSEMKYINSLTKIKIKCNLHDEYFFQSPVEHLRGRNGCNICKKKISKTEVIIKKSKTLNNDEFILRSVKSHGDKYDYSLVNYVKNNIKVKIVCPIHGEFEQTPVSHIRGKGCNKCGIQTTREKLSFDVNKFINKSNLTHNDKYDYSLTEYINSHTKVKIICPIHGEFEQLPYDHVTNHGCNKCTTSVSKLETEINDFIKSFSIETITSSMSIIKPNQIDIFVPSNNLAIEFDGLYWHSELHKDKNYHLNKTELCEAKGIKLIHVFEDEWLFKQDIVKSRIKNILGLTGNKIFGRKCDIREVNSIESKDFLNNNHIQGNVNSSIKLGLYYNNELVSLMLFGKPRLGIGKKYDGYELTRFCNKLDTTVIGGASKLLKYFIKIYNPKQIVSYADRRWSQGDLYSNLGFTEITKNKPNYWYIIGKSRKHRFAFRKDILIKEGFDNSKSEHEIMLERGIYRVYDCGTITYKLLL
jgi:hypothetical protein